ncbi:unnamed protein product [Anisakis simplex]|uniref:HMG box domain-containing protein n=1 Tax=Anisakis simplex TaxID=6269 RepID=A0A0M3KF21_ANISI|nr:unnamed protein product [Anisakis simplex]
MRLVEQPVSAYALFFRDTQAAIKGRTPNATFGEVSKIVASMWDALDGCAKNSYKQKTESAKREYLKRLAAYRASQISQDNANGCNGLENANAVVQRDTTPRYYEPQSVPNATNPTQIGDVSLANLIALPPVKQQPYNPGTPAFTVGVRNDYVASEWNNARCSMLQQPPQMTANFV